MSICPFNEQKKDYSLLEQEDRLLKYCNFNNIEVKGVCREYHSAKNFNRPEWKRIILGSKKEISRR